MKTLKRKLRLNKVTVTDLAKNEMTGVNGGGKGGIKGNTKLKDTDLCGHSVVAICLSSQYTCDPACVTEMCV